MRRPLVFTLLAVIASSTGCSDWDYAAKTGREHVARNEKVLPAEGPQRDFYVSIAGDLPRLLTVMGNPSDFHEVQFAGSGLDVEVIVGAKKDRIGKWRMDTDGSVTHRTVEGPINHYDCTDRQPFSIDAATIAQLPQLVADARDRAGYLDNPQLQWVRISRNPGQIPFKCGKVEIDAYFEGDCGSIWLDKHGAKFYDCPTGDVVYDLTGKFLRSTIDRNPRRYYD